MVSWITCHPTNEGDINNLLVPANSANQTGDNNTFDTDQNTINRLLPNDTPLVNINVQEPQNINSHVVKVSSGFEYFLLTFACELVLAL
jgi:hypothetical protein